MQGWRNIILPESQEENKTTKKLTANLVAGGIVLPLHPSAQDLRPLGKENGIPRTKTVDKESAVRQKRTEEMKRELASTGFIFDITNRN